MECLVTGAAGFIGSHLCEQLLKSGNRVIGVDCYTPYYSRDVKENHIRQLKNHRWFTFQPLDLCSDSLAEAVRDVDWVFHLAAMPGLVKSWTDFDLYHQNNIVGTHRLLEALRDSPTLKRMVYASTSSVYGRYGSGDETLPTKPSSPYGVTKLAGENLCRVYFDEFQIPVVNLRYFSVYGPRQRPDMGYHKFIDAVLKNKPITMFGDGKQTRGNTYVGDCVDATIRAANAPAGEIYNVGGGDLVTLWDVVEHIERICKRKATIIREPVRKGDQRHTGADITKITRHLGWVPKVGIEEGLERQIAWHSEATQRAAA